MDGVYYGGIIHDSRTCVFSGFYEQLLKVGTNVKSTYVFGSEVRIPPIQRFIPIVITLAFVFGLSYLWATSDDLPVGQKILASVVIFVSVLPTFLYTIDRNRPIIPLLALNSLFYLFAFGVTGFYYCKDEVIITLTSIDNWSEGLLIGIVGLVCQIVAYYSVRTVFGRVKPIHVIRSLTTRQINFLGWSMLAFRLLMILLPGAAEMPSIGQFAKLTPYVGFGLLATLAFLGKMGLGAKILLYCVAIPLELLYRVSGGAVYEPVILMVLIFLIRWITIHKVDLRLAVVSILLFAILNPIKHEFRQATWKTYSGAEYSVIEKLNIFTDIAFDYWLNPQSNREDIGSNLISRMNHLAICSVVAGQTPNGGVSYWYGESLELGIYSFIPRILWPGKPGMSVANHFGRKYGIISITDESTTINVTWTVEMYMNFGWPGLVFGMLIVGAAFAFLERWYATPGTSLIDVIIPLTITFQLIYPESNIMGMWGGVLTGMAAVYTLAWSVSSQGK